MEIETPRGSGNFITIYTGRNGDLVVSLKTTDSTGFRQRASIEFHGCRKGELEPEETRQLYNALRQFAD